MMMISAMRIRRCQDCIMNLDTSGFEKTPGEGPNPSSHRQAGPRLGGQPHLPLREPGELVWLAYPKVDPFLKYSTHWLSGNFPLWLVETFCISKVEIFYTLDKCKLPTLASDNILHFEVEIIYTSAKWKLSALSSENILHFESGNILHFG